MIWTPYIRTVREVSTSVRNGVVNRFGAESTIESLFSVGQLFHVKTGKEIGNGDFRVDRIYDTKRTYVIGDNPKSRDDAVQRSAERLANQIMEEMKIRK